MSQSIFRREREYWTVVYAGTARPQRRRRSATAGDL
jgi:hypothetical protein